ncbi:MAG: nitroreductase family protein, partial [Coprobacillus sp.]|nr:nitroreductase family protein [Coprobacillus sp.]
MNTFENIMTRRSTRKYLDQSVSQELLEKIIETGRYAPSG